MAASKKQAKKTPLTERTESRGNIELKLPGIELCMPATNRSAMIIACVSVSTTMLLVLAMAVILVWVPAENLTSLGEIIGRKDADARAPVKARVETDDGIEIIEVCPPPDCDRDCPCLCPNCPVCTPAPVVSAPMPPLKLRPEIDAGL